LISYSPNQFLRSGSGGEEEGFIRKGGLEAAKGKEKQEKVSKRSHCEPKTRRSLRAERKLKEKSAPRCIQKYERKRKNGGEKRI